MSPFLASTMRWLRWTGLAIAVLALLAFGLAWWVLHRSLPQLDGTLAASTLSAPATIERDARGTPVITATTRRDLAFATGFAHGQDRFFQMDLTRRLAAGELSEVFGPIALQTDTRTRRFGFRAVARRVIEATPPAERAVVEAYARGVNAGRESLATRPWEYLLLRATPRAWSAEDSVLVGHSMWWQLQYNSLVAEIDRRRFERAAAAQGGTGGPEAAHALVAFVYAGRSDWDTPNHGPETCAAGCGLPAVQSPYPELLKFAGPTDDAGGEPKLPGSNNWAVSGTHTKSGAALIANDMHLELGVPAAWYPARLRLAGGTAAASDGPLTLDITGVTLPGAPAVIAGSNGHIAWGFTNSYGDFADVRWGPCQGPHDRVRRERIEVRGRDAAEVEYRDIGAGMVLDGEEYAADVKTGECAQAAWLATRVEATNFAVLQLENARTVDEVLALAPAVGIPGQNLVVGDTGGRIAWTLLGRVPRTRGPDRLFGALEFTDASDHPRLVDPPVGRLWTANQRVVDGAQEAALGDDEVDVGAGGYDIGARARQIRDDLVGLAHPATEADMLAIQTDARGLFVVRWREQLLALLDDAALRAAPARREFRELVSQGTMSATPGAVGYRLVRAWRGNVLDALWHSLATGLMGAPQGPDMKFVRRPGQFEAAGWRLVSERPVAVAPPSNEVGGDWRAFLLARVDATIAALAKECGSLAKCTYGAGKRVAIRHPLSRSLPFLSGLLDMPEQELAGDHHMPRVQDGPFGASERFAVSPGHEAEGYLELPGGPSGHPLSPFYRSGFEDWAAGRPTPFLPGPPVHRLELTP